jgi:hypothetical protein
MTYGTPWEEFSAALALVDQDNLIEVSFDQHFVTFAMQPSAFPALKSVLHSFKIRRWREPTIPQPNEVRIYVSTSRFDGLPFPSAFPVDMGKTYPVR